jgi:Methyltransferase domain
VYRSFFITVSDIIGSIFAFVNWPILKFIGRYHHQLMRVRKLSDRFGFQIRSTHYYQPTYAEQDLPIDTTGERNLPGLNLQPSKQLNLLSKFNFSNELSEIGYPRSDNLNFGHDNPAYAFADAESLYCMIRFYKPKKIVEIGSGFSTLMVKKAISANKIEDESYICYHVCIEPYEMPWLDQLDVNVVRQRVQDVDLNVFSKLEKNDILFVDSSHVIRPFGDVLVEYLQIIPMIKAGVLVHVHDIFTPRDYPESWLRSERRLWNEQYILEAMLAHSKRYSVLLAVNWLKHNYWEHFSVAFPRAAENPDHEPGAFWFEVVDDG